MEIYLIRHPQADIEAGICYGQTDIDLKKEDIKKAITKINMLVPHIPVSKIYSSDLKRCKAIAQDLDNNRSIIYSSKIREINFGKWEMKRWDEIPKHELNIWMEDFVNQNCYDGESYKDLYTRVVQFWKELINENHSQTLVIAHGGVIRSILCYILNISLKNSFKLNIDLCSISKIKIDQASGLKKNQIETVEFINK
jgi:alpha-ribazole phosphatase